MEKKKYIEFTRLSFEEKVKRLNHGEVNREELRKVAREQNFKIADREARRQIRKLHRYSGLIDRIKVVKSNDYLKFGDRQRVVEVKYNDQKLPTPMVRFR